MAKSGWFRKGTNGATKKPQEGKTMTTYEIRQPRWSVHEGETAQALYTFKTWQDFVAYATIQAKTHESVTIRYDKEHDVLYVED